MVLLRLSPVALSRSRFALSPAAEVLGAIITLARPCTDPWAEAWYGQHQRSFAARLGADPFARGLIGLVSATKWLPDFVAIPPRGGMRTTLPSELAAMAAMPDETVRATLAQSVRHGWNGQDLAWLDGHGWAARTAEIFAAAWQAYVAPDWARRRALLERDVMYRAGLLAAYGWPRALDRMSRRSAWVGDDAIRFSDRPGPDRLVGEAGMLFVPVNLSGGSWLCEQPPDEYALVYPARGVGVRDEPVPDRALDRLIGAGRAAILRSLERPATSTELAAEFDLSLGTVGGHVAILRDASLIEGARVGRRVIYRRTDAGDLLAERRP